MRVKTNPNTRVKTKKVRLTKKQKKENLVKQLFIK
jgi:hypothetical protein